MHCPKCGQLQISEETSFCSRCGLLLSGVAEVVANDGQLPGVTSQTGKKRSSARTRGLKQGVFILLLALLLVPLAGMLSIALDSEPFIAGFFAVLTTMGGFLRIVYALMFESGEPGSATIEQQLLAGTKTVLGRKPEQQSLPAATTPDAAVYASPRSGKWMDTNDLAREPASVTDNTTKLLTKEEES